MDQAILETGRRRKIQEEYNQKHHITPQSVKKSIRNILASIYEADYFTVPSVSDTRRSMSPSKRSPPLFRSCEKK